MMAAFIIAVRGTVAQAVLLGLSAAISHSLIIWLLAVLALHYGNQWNAEAVEPYLNLGSAVLIFCLAVWMFVRTRREVLNAAAHQPAPPVTPSPDVRQHEMALPVGLKVPERLAKRAGGSAGGPQGGMMLDTGHGWLEIAIHAENGDQRFRIYPCVNSAGKPGAMMKGQRLTIETVRLDGSSQLFQFEPRASFWEATAVLPEPRDFLAVVTMGHADHSHVFKVQFHSDPSHAQAVVAQEIMTDEGEYQDAHERAHAEDIARRFSNRSVTTTQIVMFGITGGLIPCPAAFTILLVCLQLKRATLGFAIVGAFSFGLAVTMVSVGVMAAWSASKAQKRFSGFGEAMRKAPFVSSALLVVLAAYMAWSGWHGLARINP